MSVDRREVRLALFDVRGSEDDLCRNSLVDSPSSDAPDVLLEVRSFMADAMADSFGGEPAGESEPDTLPDPDRVDMSFSMVATLSVRALASDSRLGVLAPE